MKNYHQIIKGQRYEYFYDRSLRSWTVLKLDSEGNQIDEAEYYSNKSQLLASYDFKFISFEIELKPIEIKEDVNIIIDNKYFKQ